MNARKQRRVKAVSCKYSLMRVLSGESCDCITGEEIDFERIDFKISTVKYQLELAFENIIHLKKFSKCKILSREL